MKSNDEEILYSYQTPVSIGKTEPSSPVITDSTEQTEAERVQLYYLDKQGQRRRLSPNLKLEDCKSTRAGSTNFQRILSAMRVRQDAKYPRNVR